MAASPTREVPESSVPSSSPRSSRGRIRYGRSARCAQHARRRDVISGGPQAQIENVLRECAPRVLGALVRRYGDFDVCEDALQEALLAAAQQWRVVGVPDSPHGWLTTVASRRHTELWRNEVARRRREETVAREQAVDEQRRASSWPTPSAVRGDVDNGADGTRDDEDGADGTRDDEDDTLTLLFLCCHPSLTAASQVALTLRAVGGLTTAEIARAFLVPEATIAQRISRAKGPHPGQRRPVLAPARSRALRTSDRCPQRALSRL